MLKDKRSEMYEPPPPPKYVAYSGSGVSMGGEEIKSEGLSFNKDNA